MMNKATAVNAAKLYHMAVEQAGDVKAGCLALVAAAMACQHMLRDVMPAAKVDDMMSILSVAGAVLIDDDCGGLLDLATPAGRA